VRVERLGRIPAHRGGTINFCANAMNSECRGGRETTQYLAGFSVFLTSYEIRKKNQTEDVETA
jgi:hypothetical protein